MPDIAQFIPGGIKPTDHVHQETNDGRCSRCGALVSDYDVPLILFSDDLDDMLLYCSRCLKVPAAHDAGSTQTP